MAAVNRPNAPQDYRTPPELLDAVQARFGQISFDLACTRENAVAPLGYCYPEHDALAQSWTTLLDDSMTELFVCWCNPPFGKSRDFARMAAESQSDHHELAPTVLLLVPAAVDSNWYREHVHDKALVLPLSPRVAFVGQPTAINRPLMLCVYGPHITPGFAPWQWKQPKNKQKKET